MIEPIDERAPPEVRRFTDSVGVTWTVREIEPLVISEAFERLRRGERRRPWLVFESEGDKRRLVPVPEGWVSLSDFVLERWCLRAERVPPAPARREEDRDDARDETPRR